MWGVRYGKTCRTWVPSEMDALPIQLEGLAVPFIPTTLLTKTTTHVGRSANTASSRDLLIDDFIWGSTESGLANITTCWMEDKHSIYRATLWFSGGRN